MIKSEAISLINKKLRVDLNYRNTIFSNPGLSLELWWLEPANEKFKTGFYFILHDTNRKKLLLFKVPGNAVGKSQFRQRGEKGASQIIIPISDKEFIDRKGFNFTRFLIN